MKKREREREREKGMKETEELIHRDAKEEKDTQKVTDYKVMQPYINKTGVNIIRSSTAIRS